MTVEKYQELQAVDFEDVGRFVEPVFKTNDRR